MVLKFVDRFFCALCGAPQKAGLVPLVFNVFFNKGKSLTEYQSNTVFICKFDQTKRECWYSG